MLFRSHNHEASQLSVFQGTILLEAFVLMMLFSTLEEENYCVDEKLLLYKISNTSTPRAEYLHTGGYRLRAKAVQIYLCYIKFSCAILP